MERLVKLEFQESREHQEELDRLVQLVQVVLQEHLVPQGYKGLKETLVVLVALGQQGLVAAKVLRVQQVHRGHLVALESQAVQVLREILEAPVGLDLLEASAVLERVVLLVQLVPQDLLAALALPEALELLELQDLVVLRVGLGQLVRMVLQEIQAALDRWDQVAPLVDLETREPPVHLARQALEA